MVAIATAGVILTGLARQLGVPAICRLGPSHCEFGMVLGR
jgi:hypothetical protein